jgi:hypothetical protein
METTEDEGAIAMRSSSIGLCLALLGLASSQPATAAADRIFFSNFDYAVLLLNEVNANITGSQDLVELRALSDGNVSGISLVQNPGPGGTSVVLATLPDIPLAAGDLIVIHLAPMAGPATETTTKQDCTFLPPQCFANAWDVQGGATGLTYSDRVLALVDPAGNVMDAAAFALPAAIMPASFPGVVAYIQSFGQWLPADCGGAPCDANSIPTVVQISADWTGLGSSAVTGNSIARSSATDTNQAADWRLGANTFGADNL